MPEIEIDPLDVVDAIAERVAGTMANNINWWIFADLVIEAIAREFVAQHGAELAAQLHARH